MPAQTDSSSCVMDKRKADETVEKRPSKSSRSYDDMPGMLSSSLALTEEDVTTSPFIDVFCNSSSSRAQPFQQEFAFPDHQQGLPQQQQHMLPDANVTVEMASNTLATRSRVLGLFQLDSNPENTQQLQESWSGSTLKPRPVLGEGQASVQDGGDEQQIQFRNGSWKIMSAPEPSLPPFIHAASLNLPKSGIFSGVELVILLFYSYELFFEDTPYSIIKKILGTERGRTTLRRKLYKTLGKYDKKVNQLSKDAVRDLILKVFWIHLDALQKSHDTKDVTFAQAMMKHVESKNIKRMKR